MSAEGREQSCAERPNCSCGKPRLPNNPFCAECDLRVLIVAREMFSDAAASDFEREVPRG